MNSGLRPNKLGIAEDFLGKALTTNN